MAVPSRRWAPGSRSGFRSPLTRKRLIRAQTYPNGLEFLVEGAQQARREQAPHLEALPPEDRVSEQVPLHGIGNPRIPWEVAQHDETATVGVAQQ